MLPLREQIDALRKLGYGADTAQAKVVHDVVLLAMHRSGFKANSTIKGGVVMSSLTGDVRRATMDDACQLAGRFSHRGFGRFGCFLR